MKIIATHNGSFHADDVFAVATLMIAFKGEGVKVIRVVRDTDEMEKADIILDIGRKYDQERYFDHHQEGGAGTRENGIPYASFGLIWKKFSPLICSEDEAAIVDKNLVTPIDAIDNGVNLSKNIYENIFNYTFSSFIASLNPTSLEEQKFDESFLEAVSFAIRSIEREVAYAKEFKKLSSAFEGVYENSLDKKLIILDEHIPKIILNTLLPKFPEVLFIVQPYENLLWAVRTAKKSSDTFENRKDLPLAWAGKFGEELANISGVSDAAFCHNKLFVANAKSKEGAIKLAQIALES